jgi:hypothetical protein
MTYTVIGLISNRGLSLGECETRELVWIDAASPEEAEAKAVAEAKEDHGAALMVAAVVEGKISPVR